MAPIKREQPDQFRISFQELARVRRGEPVEVDPFLIARAIALVMRECTVRSAAGQPLLWNQYRVVLARRDFELVRALQGPLERDLQQVLVQEAQTRQAQLLGELRITVVHDEADELRAGEAAVRVAFVPTDKLPAPRGDDMTVRFDGPIPGAMVAGEIAARPPIAPDDTVFVDDSGAGSCTLRWPGGEVRIPAGATAMLGRPHPGAPDGFVALAGAGARINKQHLWIAIGPAGARVGRLAGANPVHIEGRALAAGEDLEVALPVEISLSRGELVLSLRRT